MSDANVIAFNRPESCDVLLELCREGARKMIAAALEAEVQSYLESYSDRVLPNGKAAVVRNGYHPERDLQTGVGPVKVSVPKVRARDGEPVSFRSALVPPYVRKARSLEVAVPWLYLKGISSGEMASALEVLVGKDATGLSANTVSRLKHKWGEEYQAWRQQDLSRHEWIYWWVDGIYSGLRTSDTELCALVIIGVNERGEKHFLAIEDGVRESTQSWREVLLHLKAQGIGKAPKLAVGDGAMGFWAALDEVYPQTKHQRCWVHKTQNVLNCLPKAAQPKAKNALHEIWQSKTKEDAEKAFQVFVDTYDAKYPKATLCLQKDREELLAFYHFPAKHWQSLRTTNPIESTFGTIRHRTRRSKGCLTRDGMLNMMFKLGMCAEKNWRRLRGFDYLAKVFRGVKFKNGEEIVAQKSETTAA